MYKNSFHFIGWKTTFERWGWYLLLSIVLWSFTAFLNNGFFSVPRGLQYFEVFFTWLFLESLHWAHLGLTCFLLPRIQNVHLISQRILEVLFVWIIGVVCLFLFNFIPNVLVFGPVVYSSLNADNLRVAFTLGPITSIWLYYFVERVRTNERLQREHLGLSKLEKENYQARLKALKNQLSPHFLFNNLNVLASIIPYDSEKALEFTHKLSDLYRYYVQTSEEDLITLEEELEILEAYRYLLEMRFENQIEFTIDNLKGDFQQFYLPPLAIQECIENAIKHNISSRRNKLRICVSMKNQEVHVSNNKQLKTIAVPSTGTGWKNIKKRYELLGNYMPAIEENSFEYRVILPLIKKN